MTINSGFSDGQVDSIEVVGNLLQYTDVNGDPQTLDLTPVVQQIVNNNLDANDIVSANVSGSDLILVKNDSSTITVDLSSFLDDTNLSRIVSGTLSGLTLTATRNDASTFDIDLTNLQDTFYTETEIDAAQATQDAAIAQNAADILNLSGGNSEVVKAKGDASVTPFGITTLDGKWELSFGNQTGWTPRLRNVSGVTKGLVAHYFVLSNTSFWSREYQNNSMAAGVQDTATNGLSWSNNSFYGDVSIKVTWQDSDGDFYQGLILRSFPLNGNNLIFVKVEKLND